ncbi:MAG: thiolase family protein [Chloroflexi bacterium]|nr:thiolase family protein [Chloroflexota bacterium]
MTVSLRGTAAIVGIGETEHRRVWPGRSMYGLCAEAAAEAVRDAGLRREDIDGLIGFGPVAAAGLAEYIGIRPVHYGMGSNFAGSSSGGALAIATAMVSAGVANNILFVGGGARDPGNPDASIYMGGPAGGPPSMASEFYNPFGPTIAANNTYGLLYTRHMYQYGTTQEQIAHLPVNQRFNALKNPRAAFKDQPITVEDVLNSRYVNYPLHLLECVMPVAGAISFIVTTAERARTLKQPPVYVLGFGVCQGFSNSYYKPDMLESPARYSAPAAYNMSGYGVNDVQFAEFYD